VPRPVTGAGPSVRVDRRLITLSPIAARLDDADLVAAAQGGDRAALDHLLRRHYDTIHAVCRRVAGGTRDADDACQEALIKITRSLPRFDGRSSFATWAYRIATNASLDELRKRQRRPMLRAVDEDGSQPEPVDPMADRLVTSIDDRLAIDEALAALPDDFRSAVVLRDVIDLDYAEIAAVLEIPVGTVKSRIARGRAILADKLRLEDLPQLPEIPPPDGNRDGDDERPNELT